MELEYVTLETSKALHDKGFKAKHERVHIGGLIKSKMSGRYQQAGIPAYIFTELWAMLPEQIIIKAIPYRIHMDKQNGFTFLWFCSWSVHSHKSPAEAVAMLILWLLDNGHEVKQ